MAGESIGMDKQAKQAERDSLKRFSSILGEAIAKGKADPTYWQRMAERIQAKTDADPTRLLSDPFYLEPIPQADA